MNWRKVVFNILKWLFVIVPFGFLLRILVLNYGQLASKLSEANWDYVALSFGSFLIMTFLWGFMWHLETSAIGVGLPLKKALSAYFASQLAKYIPGKVWMMAARFAIYHGELGDAPRVSVAVLFEAALHLGGQLLLLVVMAMFFKWTGYESLRVVAIAILFILLVGSHPKFLQFVLNVAMKFLKKPPVKLGLTYIQVILLYVGYAIDYTFGVLGLFLLYKAFAPLDNSLLLPIAISNIISGAGGMLAIFVPAGLGVKEGLMYGILVQFISEDMSALMPVASRFLTVLAQAVLILVGLWGLKKMGVRINFRTITQGKEKKGYESS